jgi:hypothetical protein
MLTIEIGQYLDVNDAPDSNSFGIYVAGMFYDGVHLMLGAEFSDFHCYATAEQVRACYGPDTCDWTDADECSTAREQATAGVVTVIPSCPIHGPHST